VHKTVALVLALARLHKYCINENEADCDVAYSTATDEWRNKVSGAVPLVETPQQYNDDARSAGITPR
jgi:predicted secreted protein